MPLQRPRPIENSATLGNILQRSISTGALVDTKFYVFTQQTPSGALARPRPLFASAKLLQDKLDYFKRMFAPNVYRESTLLPLDEDFPFEQEPYVHNYDYDQDSDLEETYEETELPGDTKSVDGFEYIEAGSIPSDEDVYSPEIRLPGAFDPISTQPECHTIYAGRLSRNPGPLQRKGRVVIIKDTAFDTWQALLFYLYTGDIAFRPLKSQQETEPKTSFKEDGHGGEQACPQPCSPKSMYRLADKLGLDNLKLASFQAVRRGLSEKNVVQEYFSRFTFMYAEVQAMEISLLCEKYETQEVKDALARVMKQIAEGEFPHAQELLALLLNRLQPSGMATQH